MRGSLAESLRRPAPSCFNPAALCYHYRHMARGNAREYLFKDAVRPKKYFYVLRPLLAIRYLERGLGVPPVRFDKLADAVAPSGIRPGIAELLERKRATSELGLGPPIPELGRFIETELERHRGPFPGQDRPGLVD